MHVFEALKAFNQVIDTTTIGIGFAASFLIGLFLVLTKKWHGLYSFDTTVGIQKLHSMPTPRIGGLPIVLGLLLVWSQSQPQIKELLTPFLVAGMPAFLFGFAEDLTKRVGPLQRLLATFASGLLACWMSDYSLSRLSIFGVDALMQFTVISVLFTTFAVGGVANSINIIDGLNGLAAFTCTVAFTGFASIAYQVGDFNLAFVALILAACLCGFFWINWPFGKMFLGDGGAYFVGFSLAWVSVLLIERNQSVSAFSALLICIFPITEVLFSMFRRRVRKQHPGEPDRLHFHSILLRRYVNRWLLNWSSLFKNSLVGIILGMISLPVAILSIIFFESSLLCIGFVALFVLGYILIYFRMVSYNSTCITN